MISSSAVRGNLQRDGGNMFQRRGFAEGQKHVDDRAGLKTPFQYWHLFTRGRKSGQEPSLSRRKDGIKRAFGTDHEGSTLGDMKALTE